jgi:hypothetical protein
VALMYRCLLGVGGAGPGGGKEGGGDGEPHRRRAHAPHYRIAHPGLPAGPRARPSRV